MLAYALGGAAIAGLFFMPVFPSFVLIDWIDARWLDLMARARPGPMPSSVTCCWRCRPARCC